MGAVVAHLAGPGDPWRGQTGSERSQRSGYRIKAGTPTYRPALGKASVKYEALI
jgi:hypothetical protein